MDPSIAPGPFLGRSKAVAQLLALIERAAQVEVPVLLTGETGTGKSHLARLLHARSPRREGPFVSVNCAGVPDGLFESEFFGHSRGAFTGAIESRAGLFEQAHGGTLFLDEVGELPLSQQAKLLTAIEERRVRPVGASRPRAVDVRIVAATSRPITSEVAAGSFRPDLYHRIALIRCELPPLRTRPDDLLFLTSHLLKQLGRKYGRSGVELDESGWAFIVSHAWPGNFRELAHTLEAAVILCDTQTIGAERLEQTLAQSVAGPAVADSAPARTADRNATSTSNVFAPPSKSGRRYSFFGTEAEERETIRGVLVRFRGNRTRAASELGMARNTLGEKVRKYGLE